MTELKALPQGLREFIASEYPDVSISDYDGNGNLFLETHGDCASCPFQCLSQEKGIASDVKARFAQINEVTVNPAVSEELLNMAKKMLVGK